MFVYVEELCIHALAHQFLTCIILFMPRNIKPKRIAVAIGGGVQRNGETRDIDRYVLSLIKKEHPHVVFFPTASKDREDNIQSFMNEFDRLGSDVYTIRMFKRRLKKADFDAIDSADVIYFGGGEVQLLSKNLKRKNILERIETRYNQGAILVGNSAGAAIFFPSYKAINKSGVIETGEGLNLLDTDLNVFLHYRSQEKFSISRKKTKYIAIPDSGAMVFINERPSHGIGVEPLYISI